MRARDGRRTIPVPSWIVIASETGRPARGRSLSVTCTRCGRTSDMSDMVRLDAEQDLGRFVGAHRRCRDPEVLRLEREAREAHAASRRTRAGFGASVVYVRKKGP